MENSKLTASTIELKLHVNGVEQTTHIDTRTTLLDALRNIFELPGTKKGCDQGACGVFNFNIIECKLSNMNQ